MPKKKTKQHKHKGNHGHKYSHKTANRAKFLSPHEDQLYEEFHLDDDALRGGGEDDLAMKSNEGGGAFIRTSKANRRAFGEDKPGGGQYYCEVTGRHFESALALRNHEKTKRYKKLKRLIHGPKPHSQSDAEAAAGVVPPSNT